MKKTVTYTVSLFATGLFLLLAVELFAQQDAQYSQYMFNQLALNPACAGSREVLGTSMLYRNQWTGISGAPTTGTFSFQMPLRKKKIGIGAEILTEKIGPRSTNAILASYSYRIPFLKGKLSFGLRMGIYDYVFDWSKMDYKDQNDAYYINNMDSRTAKITGSGDFGFYYYSRTFYWGFSATHVNQGRITDFSNSDSSARQSVHMFMPVSKAFEVGNTVINPVVLIKTAANAPVEMDMGCNVQLKNRIWLGFSARTGYGIVFLAQYQITEQLKAGYSYDYGMNKIGHAGKGSHEIMIGYDINITGTKVLSPRYL